MLYRKISKETGEFIEDVIFESHPINDEEFEFVRDEPPSGLYKKIWKGGKWVEGMTPAEIKSKKDSFSKPTAKSFKSMSRVEKDVLLEEIAKQMGLIQNERVVLP